jgi:hypothetical protein
VNSTLASSLASPERGLKALFRQRSRMTSVPAALISDKMLYDGRNFLTFA